MPILCISTDAKRRALLQAVEFMADYTTDELGERGEEISNVSDEQIDSVVQEIRRLKKENAFAKTFSQALRTVIASPSSNVYLEPFEANIVRDGLNRFEDVEDNDVAQVYDIISEDNIKQIVLKTRTSWGSVDPSALARELKRQVTDVLESNTAVRELLADLER